mmetsp:Transcript_20153/g.47627  ORF Transcript_20153/g.47627 Transcript_20153/m.47627 type:complete len:261 (-) Transcript_20153:686-1468(-)
MLATLAQPARGLPTADGRVVVTSCAGLRHRRRRVRADGPARAVQAADELSEHVVHVFVHVVAVFALTLASVHDVLERAQRRRVHASRLECAWWALGVAPREVAVPHEDVVARSAGREARGAHAEIDGQAVGHDHNIVTGDEARGGDEGLRQRDADHGGGAGDERRAGDGGADEVMGGRVEVLRVRVCEVLQVGTFVVFELIRRLLCRRRRVEGLEVDGLALVLGVVIVEGRADDLELAQPRVELGLLEDELVQLDESVKE